jgi:translation elongation factor EF-Tu-like GTPase
MYSLSYNYIRKVERGIATKGAEVEVVGLGNTFKTTLTGIGERINNILVFCNSQMTL